MEAKCCASMWHLERKGTSSSFSYSSLTARICNEVPWPGGYSGQPILLHESYRVEKQLFASSARAQRIGV